MEIKQYDIVLINLDPTVGAEIKKTRPCVIISPDEMNKHLQTIIVAPMTSQSRSYPTRVEVKHDNKKGWIVIDQVRSVDRMRIIKILDKLNAKEIAKVKKLLQEMFVD